MSILAGITWAIIGGGMGLVARDYVKRGILTNLQANAILAGAIALIVLARVLE